MKDYDGRVSSERLPRERRTPSPSGSITNGKRLDFDDLPFLRQRNSAEHESRTVFWRPRDSGAVLERVGSFERLHSLSPASSNHGSTEDLRNVGAHESRIRHKEHGCLNLGKSKSQSDLFWLSKNGSDVKFNFPVNGHDVQSINGVNSIKDKFSHIAERRFSLSVDTAFCRSENVGSRAGRMAFPFQQANITRVLEQAAAELHRSASGKPPLPWVSADRRSKGGSKAVKRFSAFFEKRPESPIEVVEQRNSSVFGKSRTMPVFPSKPPVATTSKAEIPQGVILRKSRSELKTSPELSNQSQHPVPRPDLPGCRGNEVNHAKVEANHAKGEVIVNKVAAMASRFDTKETESKETTGTRNEVTLKRTTSLTSRFESKEVVKESTKDVNRPRNDSGTKKITSLASKFDVKETQVQATNRPKSEVAVKKIASIAARFDVKETETAPVRPARHKQETNSKVAAFVKAVDSNNSGKEEEFRSHPVPNRHTEDMKAKCAKFVERIQKVQRPEPPPSPAFSRETSPFSHQDVLRSGRTAQIIQQLQQREAEVTRQPEIRKCVSLDNIWTATCQNRETRTITPNSFRRFMEFGKESDDGRATPSDVRTGLQSGKLKEMINNIETSRRSEERVIENDPVQAKIKPIPRKLAPVFRVDPSSPTGAEPRKSPILLQKSSSFGHTAKLVEMHEKGQQLSRAEETRERSVSPRKLGNHFRSLSQSSLLSHSDETSSPSRSRGPSPTPTKSMRIAALASFMESTCGGAKVHLGVSPRSGSNSRATSPSPMTSQGKTESKSPSTVLCRSKTEGSIPGSGDSPSAFRPVMKLHKNQLPKTEAQKRAEKAKDDVNQLPFDSLTDKDVKALEEWMSQLSCERHVETTSLFQKAKTATRFQSHTAVKAKLFKRENSFTKCLQEVRSGFKMQEWKTAIPWIDDSNIFQVQLTKDGRGFGLGIGVEDLAPTEARVVRINRVSSSQPAAQDGRIQIGDIILGVQDAGLIGLTHQDVLSTLRCSPSTSLLTIWRPPVASPPKPQQTFEVALTKVNGSLGFTLNKEVTKKGLQVSALVKEPAKSDGRLRPGDYIVKVNDKTIATLSFSEAIQTLRAASDPVRLTVLRDSSNG